MIPKWKAEADARNQIAFVPCVTVKSDKCIVWTKAIGVYQGHEYVPKSETKFSIQAQLRFGSAIDNFVNMFKAINERDPSIIYYREHWKRQAVHMTLTVPDQNGLSDLEMKQHCLEPFLDNLSKHHGVILWLWKAEAQLRGAIHWHVIVDKYLEEPVMRELWYNCLKRVGCIDPRKISLEHASSIVYLKPCPDLSLMKLELMGYFAAATDADGNTKYKHDHTKLVRNIEGGSWGCCDRLKYKQMTVWNAEEEFLEDLPNRALEDFEVKEKWTPEQLRDLKSGILSEEGKKNIQESKRSFGHCFLFKKIDHVQGKKIVLSREYDNSLQETLNSYHFLQGVKAYGTGVNDKDKVNRHFTRADELMIAKNGMYSLFIPHPSDQWLFDRYN